MYLESIFDTLPRVPITPPGRVTGQAGSPGHTDLVFEQPPINASQLHRISLNWNQSEPQTQCLSLLPTLVAGLVDTVGVSCRNDM